ncbi:UNVERIFIED_CONTAM: methyltransferase MTA70, putative [Hammondia hammondi]|eukprot:XP_008889313.1 methyltransferase MTA70, putative [Hammondia hammondi]
MSSHLRQRFQQRKLGLSGSALPSSLPSAAPSSGPSSSLLTPPLASLSRSTSGASAPSVSPSPAPFGAQGSNPTSGAVGAAEAGGWGERGASGCDAARDDSRPERPAADPGRDARGTDYAVFSDSGRAASRRPLEEGSRGPPRLAEFGPAVSAPLEHPRRQDAAAVLPPEPAQLASPGGEAPFFAASSGAAAGAGAPQSRVFCGPAETGVSGRALRPTAALPPLPPDLPLDHPSVSFLQNARLPGTLEELLLFVLRALLHHPAVSPSLRRGPAETVETVKSLTRAVDCHIELNAFAAHLKQVSRAGPASGRGSSLATQRLFRPEAVLRVLQFAGFRADGDSQDAPAPVVGALSPFPYPLLALASINSVTVIKAVFPLRICAVLFMLFQQAQQPPAAPSQGPRPSRLENPRPVSVGAPFRPQTPAPTPPQGPPQGIPRGPPQGVSQGPPQGPPAPAPPPPPPPPPGFACAPYFSGGGPPTALGSNGALGPPGAPPPPPPPPACEGDKKGGAGDKAVDAELQEDLEKLLSVPTALKQRDLDSGSELTSLLSAPTARQQMILHSFKNKGGSALREICTYGSRVECCRARNSFKPCSKVHFRRIVLPHTDVSLGDCSYLDTCRHIETCRYVHYEVDDASKNDALKKMRGEASADPYAIGTISAGACTEYPAQWIRCDIRTFDFSIFRKLIRVVMADPPWDIHMDLPYGTMTDQEMRSLRVDLIQEEGLLFLWVTGRAMELARECLQLWGYRRVEEILWVKTNQLQRIIRTGRTGHWLNHSKEHCLVAVKGDVPFNRNIDCDVIVSEVRETSRKPDEIYRMIERMAPDSLKVELFGRMHNVRNNWITLGNQLKGVKIEHPLLRERYNAFAEREGLPVAEVPSASNPENENSNADEKSEEVSGETEM